MPPVIPSRYQRQAQVLAGPQNQAKVLSQQLSAAVILVYQTDIDYDLSPFDIGKVVEGTSSSARTWTIPFSVDLDHLIFPLNVVLEGYQAGTGPITIAGAGGVTIVPPPGYSAVTGGQGATIGLRQRALNVWAVDGFVSV